MQSLALDRVKDDWSVLEVWVDPLQLPPYILLLLGDRQKTCYILDPSKDYELVETFPTYQEAQLWLLEDEYEPIEGRLSGTEVRGNP